jgi:hypothetical protein
MLTHFSGYVSIGSKTGKQVWYDGVLHKVLKYKIKKKHSNSINPHKLESQLCMYI